MSRSITIALPDALEPLLQEVARARGTSVEQAAVVLLGEVLRLPPRVPSDPDELERELIKGLEGPGWAPTAEEWAKRTQELIDRYGRSKAG